VRGQRTTDGWTELSVVVTDDVADRLVELGRERYRSLDAEERRRVRAVCDAKGFALDDVLTGLGLSQAMRRAGV
jgi:hypothetical protein